MANPENFVNVDTNTNINERAFTSSGLMLFECLAPHIKRYSDAFGSGIEYVSLDDRTVAACADAFPEVRDWFGMAVIDDVERVHVDTSEIVWHVVKALGDVGNATTSAQGAAQVAQAAADAASQQARDAAQSASEARVAVNDARAIATQTESDLRVLIEQHIANHPSSQGDFDATSILARLLALEEDETDLRARVDATDLRVAALEAREATHSAALAGIQTQLAAQAAQIAALQTQLATHVTQTGAHGGGNSGGNSGGDTETVLTGERGNLYTITRSRENNHTVTVKNHNAPGGKFVQFNWTAYPRPGSSQGENQWASRDLAPGEQVSITVPAKYTTPGTRIVVTQYDKSPRQKIMEWTY
jgi:uncharacterized coiled-coil protein SlyX